MPGLNYTLGLDSSSGIAGLSAMRGALSGFTGMVGKLGPLMGLAGGLGIAGGAVAGFKKAIDEAAQMEGFEVGFKTLLGSATAATARMRDLAKFAADTPFELPEIAQASRTLETLTKGALSTGKGLTLVGDVASGTQQPFGDLAVTIGRLYDGLQSGRPVGEAMARLQELGVISGETRGEIEKLQASGARGDAVWGIAQAALGRFSGMMKEQSGTWNGLMSTLKDGINAVFREFGVPILPALKPILSDGITLTEQLAATARRWGENVAYAIGLFRNAKDAGRIGELAGLSLRVGFADATNWLTEKLASIWAETSAGASGMFAGLATLFAGIGRQLGATISEGIIHALDTVNIRGVKVMSAESVETGLAAAQDNRNLGALEEKLGLKQLGKTALGGVASAFKGLLTPVAEARAALAKLKAELAPAPAAPGKPEAWVSGGKPAALGPAGAALADRIQPFSDRLARIGGFIGGSGGARGEKAAQDTARNTTALVTGNLETNRLLARLDKPSGVFA